MAGLPDSPGAPLLAAIWGVLKVDPLDEAGLDRALQSLVKIIRTRWGEVSLEHGRSAVLGSLVAPTENVLNPTLESFYAASLVQLYRLLADEYRLLWRQLAEQSEAAGGSGLEDWVNVRRMADLAGRVAEAEMDFAASALRVRQFGEDPHD